MHWDWIVFAVGMGAGVGTSPLVRDIIYAIADYGRDLGDFVQDRLPHREPEDTPPASPAA